MGYLYSHHVLAQVARVVFIVWSQSISYLRIHNAGGPSAMNGVTKAVASSSPAMTNKSGKDYDFSTLTQGMFSKHWSLFSEVPRLLSFYITLEMNSRWPGSFEGAFCCHLISFHLYELYPISDVYCSVHCQILDSTTTTTTKIIPIRVHAHLIRHIVFKDYWTSMPASVNTLHFSSVRTHLC